MAKRCEICGKGPVVGRTVSHAHNVGPRRFEPNLQTVRAIVKGATRRLRVCTRCLRNGKVTQGSLTCGRPSSRPTHHGPSGRTPRPSAPGTFYSSPVRFPSIPRPARS